MTCGQLLPQAAETTICRYSIALVLFEGPAKRPSWLDAGPVPGKGMVAAFSLPKRYCLLLGS